MKTLLEKQLEINLLTEKIERLSGKKVTFLTETLSIIPPVKSKTSDQESLRSAIIAEYDAINLYQQMANNSKDSRVKKVLLDIAKEEKTHVGELESLLKT